MKHTALLILVLTTLLWVAKGMTDEWPYNRPFNRLVWRLYVLVSLTTIAIALELWQ